MKLSKRLTAGWMAVFIFIMTIASSLMPITSYGAHFSGRNIWSGGSEIIFGQRRSYMYRWFDDFQNTFCIEPGLHMGKDVQAYAGRYHINDDNIPYISSSDEFKKLALICDWYDRKAGAKNAPNDAYAAAQTAVWAVLVGQWENAGAVAAQITPHVSGNVSAKMDQIKEYVDSALLAQGFPEWSGVSEQLAPTQNMSLSDGSYRLQLDFTGYPEISKVIWQMPAGFRYSIQGTSLIIQYEGQGTPRAVISGELPASMVANAKNSEWMAIYTPDDPQRDQAMISAGLSQMPDKIYINVGGSNYEIPETGEVMLDIWRHKETFESDYHIEIKKYCAETGLELSGAVFDVLEAFDSSQVGDGHNGSVSPDHMAPTPAIWDGFRHSGEIITDEQGYGRHSVHKLYYYDKTYCGGHPEPDYLEVPEEEIDEETGEITNGALIEGIVNENERLQNEWETLVDLCEAETDFHHLDSGTAKQQMIIDRDLTYQHFTQLRYQYMVKEKAARPGYIIHGNHNDDTAIEVISSSSSQAGAVIEIESTVGMKSRSISSPDKLNRGMLPGHETGWNPANINQRIIYPDPPALAEIRTILKQDHVENGTPSNSSKSAKKNIPKATGSNSSRQKLDEIEDFDLWQLLMEQEPNLQYYQYILHSKTDLKSEIQIATQSNSKVEHDKKELNVLKRLENLLKINEHRTYSSNYLISLPEPKPDRQESVIKGPSGTVSYVYQIENHRTEGEIHINKKDLDLASEENAYGQAQGDATLEGAVYGLFTQNDLVHPDGKTGIVYQADDLVAIAATDENGDASFLCFTEESEQSLTKSNQNGTWVGRPLLLGSYYIKELSRSEGYELSVVGMNGTQSNRLGEAEQIHTASGSAEASGLWHRIDDHDGSWNDTEITYYNTENGFDVVVSGYPEGTEIFQVNLIESELVTEEVTDRQLIPKRDRDGAIIYKKAIGGELKLDSSGNPVVTGEPDLQQPLSESWYFYRRLPLDPGGTAVPQIDPDRWNDPQVVDPEYIKQEVNDMLQQMNYQLLDEPYGDGAPWAVLELDGMTNESIGTEILDWYAANIFYNSAAVESVFWQDESYWVRLFYDFKGQSGSAILDDRSGTLYIKKPIQVSDGAVSSHIWISYPEDNTSINNFYATVSPKKVCDTVVPFGEELEDYITEQYMPAYEKYRPGELLLDEQGNPIPELEWVFTTETVTEIVRQEVLTPVSAFYQQESGTYQFHVDNTVDWSSENQKKTVTYRIKAPERHIVVAGKRMDYADYLVQIRGAGVTAIASRENRLIESYIKDCFLAYPGQIQVFQDAGTRTNPVQVYQRVIKQSIKVTKDISKESYGRNNTYKIHRDPFTVLYGGYIGQGKKFIPDFHFKLYLVSDLTKAGLLPLKPDGGYDYKALFEDESKRPLFDQYAVAWDRPEFDKDGDLTTLHASEGSGNEPYFGRSIMLPYGTYVIVEQIPGEMINKHYQIDDPKEVVLPFVPQIDQDGTIHEDIPSAEYIYYASDTPKQLEEKFLIRFNEESDVIHAHNHDGDFEVYKYGLDPDLLPAAYGNPIIAERYRYGKSENAGIADQVYYERQYDEHGQVIDYGVTLNQVPTMTGMTTAVDGKYAPALVPWSILDPRYGEIINDDGDLGNRDTGLENGSFNFIAFAKKHFENQFYSSKLRVEKIDGKTGENIIHDGAIFKIYAASRDIKGSSASGLEGSGRVLFETISVQGTRAELEQRGDVDGIVWDPERRCYTGTVTQPVYDETEQIYMINQTGTAVGIFKAFSTEVEVLRADGTVALEKVGYIETYQPLGAGVYVLVEVQPPLGYQKSKPIAFEIYKDQAAFYSDGNPDERALAPRYQYADRLSEYDQVSFKDLTQITVTDQPSRMVIHKVEDGDEIAGDGNEKDFPAGVNDQGDQVTYLVRGSKKYLEARGDVKDIRWNELTGEYQGTVTKSFSQWSEQLVAGTEQELLSRADVKLLYEAETGYFSGYGIKFNQYVSGAEMSLYQGIEIEREGSHSYRGVTVERSEGKVISIKAELAGTDQQLAMTGRDLKPPYYPVWDTVKVPKPAVELFFYDLDTVKTKTDQDRGELWALDSAGSPVSYVDSETGMAYVYDEYGQMIAYQAKEGQKQLAESIETHQDGSRDHIYLNIKTYDGEHGLPLYYESGEVNYIPEQWITDGSPHEISRLPFGAYILEETEVPYDQGYVKAPGQGIMLRQSGEIQHFYFQNQFTKVNIAKIDITDKKEIKGAEMTLYSATKVEDDSEKGYYLEKGAVYRKWISGFQYDDQGNLILAETGEPIPTDQPYWIDHIPVGYYILEESVVPYEQGYVQTESIEVYIHDTGNVQTVYLEDDYTGLEIKKLDQNTGEVMDQKHSAKLALYQAELDEQGNPLLKMSRDFPGHSIPVYLEEKMIVQWDTEDGRREAQSAHEVRDEYGRISIEYDYHYHPIETTQKGYYYITEKGTTMFHYLPVGYYVLVELENPDGYATADAMLIEVADQGHLEQISYYEMEDVPLIAEFSKVSVSGGKEVSGAHLEIFKADKNGNREGDPIYSWISGSDGIYTEEDEQDGNIPDGFTAGDLRPHKILYITEGDYILVETMTPYGFLQSVEIPFTIVDTKAVQSIEMVDEIPTGILTLLKTDDQDSQWLLEDAVFEFRNKTLDQTIEILKTDQTGKATASNAVPIGYLTGQGQFSPYTYEIIEIDAPDSHMLNTTPFEFQFQYENQFDPIILFTYQAKDQINQVKVSKKELTSQAELPGAQMMVTGKYTRQIVDHWVSTEQPHYIYGIMPGEYILTETAPPSAGYAKAESIEFTVTENMEIIPYLEMFDDHTKVEIQKKYEDSNQFLPGAKLQLKKMDGTLLYQWITTDQAYLITGLVPGEYILEEISAPSGFKVGKPQVIHVLDTLEIQVFIYRNYQIKSSGGRTIKPEPPSPEKPIKSGTVSVDYESKSNSWWEPLLDKIPKLGDLTEDPVLLGGFAAGFLSMVVLLVLACGKNKKKQGMFVLALFILSSAYFFHSHASIEPPQELMLTSESYQSIEALVPPPEHYIDESGTSFILADWEVQETYEDQKQEWVEQRVTFEGLEKDEMLPEYWSIKINDMEPERSFPVDHSIVSNQYWSDDFAFKIVLHSYDSDQFEFRQYQIPYHEDAVALLNYQEAFLEELGLDRDYYQIETITWEGEPYYDDNHILCRVAAATGRKMVTDYLVTYGGYVQYPPETVYRWEAIYQIVKEDPIKVIETEAAVTMIEEKKETETAVVIHQDEVIPKKAALLIQFQSITIMIGCILILIILIGFAIWKRKRLI